MKVWAIVPIKSLRQGKSRLREVLSDDDRMELNRKLINRTLEMLTNTSLIERILVISKDSDILRMAVKYGAMTIWEEGATPDLNCALHQATLVATSYCAKAIMVLPTDLLLISSQEIDKLLSHIESPPEIIIAPDCKYEGTNALILNPPGILDYEFGKNSYHSHIAQAKKKGIRASIYISQAFQLDLDLPEDLALLQSSGISLPGRILCYK